jgi:hypothetical protein
MSSALIEASFGERGYIEPNHYLVRVVTYWWVLSCRTMEPWK